jgi:hypothetical protein
MRLIDAEEIAGVVSAVTEALCGATFEPWDPLARGESLSGRMILLPLIGPRPLRIALAFDARGRNALAAAMFKCAAVDITPALADDAIRELLNIVAGQVQRTLGINQPLGIPRPTTLAELGGPGAQDAVLLRSQGNADLRLWIFEEGDTEGKGEAHPQTFAARLPFRSLIRRLLH